MQKPKPIVHAVAAKEIAKDAIAFAEDLYINFMINLISFYLCMKLQLLL
jgi:hypothetical protein